MRQYSIVTVVLSFIVGALLVLLLIHDNPSGVGVRQSRCNKDDSLTFSPSQCQFQDEDDQCSESTESIRQQITKTSTFLKQKQITTQAWAFVLDFDDAGKKNRPPPRKCHFSCLSINNIIFVVFYDPILFLYI
jgi:hypothetical protein